jgi:hypothetical protein
MTLVNKKTQHDFHKRDISVLTLKGSTLIFQMEGRADSSPHHFPYVQPVKFFTYSTWEVTFTLSKTQVPSVVLFVLLLGTGNPRFIPIAFREEEWCCRLVGRRLKRGIMCVRGKQSGMECPESIVSREDTPQDVWYPPSCENTGLISSIHIHKPSVW